MNVMLLTVSGSEGQKVYVKEEHILAIFPSKDGGCVLYLSGCPIELSVDEPVWEIWVKPPPKGPTPKGPFQS